MASVSYSTTAANAQEGNDPENVTLGANGPGVGDVELRVNTANITTRKDLRVAIEQFLIRLEDQRYGPSDFGLL